MKQGKWRLTALLLGLMMLPSLNAVPARADEVKIAHSTWVGYGPLYIAGDKGIFKKHGVDVDLIVMEDPKERFPTLMADRIQMIASTVDTALLYMKKPTDFQYVVAIDDSNGGDGIVAIKDIKTIADLKGRNVAVNKGSVSEFYLNVLLGKAGLEGIRSQHGEHDRGRCRRRVRRQARRCRGDLGAVAHQRQVHRFRPSAGGQLHHAGPDHRRAHRQDRLGERAPEGRGGDRQVMERGRRLL